MEKRALLAVVLSFMVLYFYYSIFSPVPPPAEITLHDEALQSTPGDVPPGDGTPPSLSAAASDDEEAVTDEGSEEGQVLFTPTSAALVERTIMIESDLYRATLSTHGANIRSLLLKEHRDRIGDEGEEYQMIWQGQKQGLYPLTVLMQSTDIQTSFKSGAWTTEFPDDRVVLSSGRAETTITFERVDERGLAVSKQITFHVDSFLIDVAVTVENRGNSQMNMTWSLVSGEGIGPEGTEKSGYVHFGPVFAYDDAGKIRMDDLKSSDLKTGERVFKDNIVWVAFSAAYFCTALIPATDQQMYAVAWNASEDIPVVALRTPVMQGRQKDSFSKQLQFYIGPKDRDQLEKVPRHLINIIDYGMFTIIALPLFKVLKFFYEYINSWGLAIIALTVLIKILFYPLTRSSYQSMEKMKLIQPEMQDLRTKYKDDPNKMNKEIWNLYKKHKVNPMGSCFPMLLQIPVFLALYNVLYVSIELRHASFLYIPDLSAYDPYYISPLLMGASMLLQQHLTPMAGDPKQVQIMKFMPVVFTVMFIYFPSGLVIYWLVNNVITIGQQLLIKRKNEAVAAAAAGTVDVPHEVHREIVKKGKKKRG